MNIRDHVISLEGLTPEKHKALDELLRGLGEPIYNGQFYNQELEELCGYCFAFDDGEWLVSSYAPTITLDEFFVMLDPFDYI